MSVLDTRANVELLARGVLIDYGCRAIHAQTYPVGKGLNLICGYWPIFDHEVPEGTQQTVLALANQSHFVAVAEWRTLVDDILQCQAFLYLYVMPICIPCAAELLVRLRCSNQYFGVWAVGSKSPLAVSC